MKPGARQVGSDGELHPRYKPTVALTGVFRNGRSQAIKLITCLAHDYRNSFVLIAVNDFGIGIFRDVFHVRTAMVNHVFIRIVVFAHRFLGPLHL